MPTYTELGIQAPRIFLPRQGIDLTRWAVIACDQFTSQPEYWQAVKDYINDSASTFNLILPEVFLGTPKEPGLIQTIQTTMRDYLNLEILVPHEGLIYVERSTATGLRKGIMVCLDLEKYNYNIGSQTLIRATEGTILERLPPRIRIREGAPLELPHILVLIDDPEMTVIEPLAGHKGHIPCLYDFELMLGSGHLAGFSVTDPKLEASVLSALARLAAPQYFQSRYGVSSDQQVLLYAIGDGNHSLATAKAIWEKVKPQVGLDHPARHALVEIENVHDAGLHFEPIHRVLFGLKQDPLAALQAFYPGQVSIRPCLDFQDMATQIDQSSGQNHPIGFVRMGETGIIEISSPPSNLPVGTLQNFLDHFITTDGAEKIDYVHGHEVIKILCCEPDRIGFYLPGMHKSDLFKTVIQDGSLPRKTFSMGEAREKRFYMEARKIIL